METIGKVEGEEWTPADEECEDNHSNGLGSFELLFTISVSDGIKIIQGSCVNACFAKYLEVAPTHDGERQQEAHDEDQYLVVRPLPAVCDALNQRQTNGIHPYANDDDLCPR